MTEDELRSRYPLCFNDERKPLALGIHESMGIAYGDPAMAAWVLHPRYLRNMLAAGAMRIDLNGNAVAPVTADERSYALRALQWQHDRLYRQYSEARWNGRRMGAVLGMTRKDVFAELGRRLPKWPKEGDKVSMPVKIDET